MILRNGKYLTLAFLLATVSANAQNAIQPDATQTDARRLVQQVVTSELGAGAADHSRWLYLEVDQTPKLHRTRFVAETPVTDVPRIIEENNHRLTETQQRQRTEAFLRDKAAQAKERKKQEEDIKQTVDLLKLLPVAFIWTTTGSQGDETTLHFQPDPHFHPPTVEARILAAVSGDLVVNASKLRIVNLKGQLVHEVKFGGGILGAIKSGGTFDIERREVSEGVWQILETHVHFEGHMLLFKSVSEQEDNVKSGYKRLPDALSLEEANNELFKTGDMAVK
jgi:hypothetical protein